MENAMCEAFSGADYVGFCVIGSLLVLLFGWGITGSSELPWYSIMNLWVANSFPALLFFNIGIYSFTFADEYKNKTIYYEKMHGISDISSILGRLVVPLVNTGIFVLTVLLAEIFSICGPGLSGSSSARDVTLKLLLTFICVLHLNVVNGLYYLGAGNSLAGAGLAVLFQWGLPVCMGNVHFLEEKKIMCANQFFELWENGFSYQLLLDIAVSCVVEIPVACVLVYFWNKRKDWK